MDRLTAVNQLKFYDKAAQLAYASALYTLLFSHPAVEAITWWDFSDRRSWQGAPSGLLRRDMSPKPLYEWLVDAFGRRWRTSVAGTADGDGRMAFRGFFGDYEVRVAAPWGDPLWGAFHLGRRDVRRLEVTLSPRPAPGGLRP